MAPRRVQKLFIVSDGTGRTCEQVVKSALVQFDESPVEIVLCPDIRSMDEVRQIIDRAAEVKGIIFFTLVSVEARKMMKDTANERMVESVDVLGPVLAGLNSVLRPPTRSRPGLYYRTERVYFDRIDAIDYTLKHDDGQRLNELSQADVVLVGVSRASKSSTCFYLAYRGIRAANVPLLPGVPPPRELTRLAAGRVIGLSINCRRLLAIRQARLHIMGVSNIDQYVGPDEVEEEVRAARDQIASNGWPWIDVSYMAIEEIARRVRGLMEEGKLRRRPRGRKKAE